MLKVKKETRAEKRGRGASGHCAACFASIYIDPPVWVAKNSQAVEKKRGYIAGCAVLWYLEPESRKRASPPRIDAGEGEGEVCRVEFVRPCFLEEQWEEKSVISRKRNAFPSAREERRVGSERSPRGVRCGEGGESLQRSEVLSLGVLPNASRDEYPDHQPVSSQIFPDCSHS